MNNQPLVDRLKATSPRMLIVPDIKEKIGHAIHIQSLPAFSEMADNDTISYRLAMLNGELSPSHLIDGPLTKYADLLVGLQTSPKVYVKVQKKDKNPVPGDSDGKPGQPEYEFQWQDYGHPTNWKALLSDRGANAQALEELRNVDPGTLVVYYHRQQYPGNKLAYFRAVPGFHAETGRHTILYHPSLLDGKPRQGTPEGRIFPGDLLMVSKTDYKPPNIERLVKLAGT